MLTIPDDLVVTVHQSLSELTMIPVSQILATPAKAEGIWDGHETCYMPTEGRFILFGFGWSKHFAGNGFEDIGKMAAEVAAHLAALDDEWPSDEVHVRALPVIDIRFTFAASPWRITPTPPLDLPASIEAMAAGMEGSSPELAARLRALTAEDEEDQC